MPKINDYQCTTEQRSVVDTFLTDGHDLFVKLVHLGLAARQSIVSLPHENEDGERVVHGANKQVSYFADCYLGAAQALVWGMQREPNRGENYFPYMVLRNRGALPGWMARLIAKNNGVIPETWTNADITRD
jgi:hypothetical protein